MPAVTLVPADLDVFATIEFGKAQAMIDDAMAIAAQFAPCILAADFAYSAAAKAIIRGAILRWNEAGTGAMQSQSAGPFAVTLDTRQQRRGMFWDAEVDQLKQLCQGTELSGAFSIDTAPMTSVGASPYPDPYLYPADWPDFAYFDGPPA